MISSQLTALLRQIMFNDSVLHLGKLDLKD